MYVSDEYLSIMYHNSNVSSLIYKNNDKFGTNLCLKMSCLFKLGAQFDLIITKQENKTKKNKLRLGAQSVTLLNTLRDPTQFRQSQWATRQ